MGLPPLVPSRRHRIPVLIGLLSVAAAWLLPGVLAAGKGEPGPVSVARIELRDKQADLKLLNRMEIDIDAVFGDWARVYLVEEEIRKLRHLGFEVTILPKPEIPAIGTRPPDEPAGRAPEVPLFYHSHATLTTDLQAIAAAHPDLVRLFDIGDSVEGRELWMMKISDNPDLDEDEPEAAYISTMHGDEIVGVELCVNLINYLTDSYGSDSEVTDLVNGTEIWIMPLMNPDGRDAQPPTRYNANGYDLNRSFPDQFTDPVNSTSGRPAEVRAVMDWTANRSINIAANMHGGALLVNYPFDGNPSGDSTFSPTPDPDQDAFFSISRSYADLNGPMYDNDGGYLDHGVTNGAEWYVIRGGMQDWAYVWYGTFEVTLELHVDKTPPASTLQTYWNENLDSMLAYFQRVHEGIRGVVTDAGTGAPLAATVHVDSNPFSTYTDPDVGDYHRIVLPGTYTITVSALGYESQEIEVEVLAGPAARYDVALQPHPSNLQHEAHRIEDGPGGDGWLDPGEIADLAVTLRNFGQPAAGVSARLEPTGWFGYVVRDEATYPDIATGLTAESYAPHYGIGLDPAVPAGHKVGFALRWSADQSAGTSEPFFLDVGAPPCETAPADDVPQPILDYQTTVSDAVVTLDVPIVEVRVAVDIQHTYIGDLRVVLVSPLGTEVVLHNRSGGSAHEIVGTYGDGLTPAEPLSVLNGESTAGTWRLEVTDNAGQDTGTLNDWSIDLCGQTVEASPPEMRFREPSVTEAGVLLRWWPYPDLVSYRVYRSTDPSSPAAFVDVTGEDDDPTDTQFAVTSADPMVYYLVTGVGTQGEGPKGHFDE